MLFRHRPHSRCAAHDSQDVLEQLFVVASAAKEIQAQLPRGMELHPGGHAQPRT